MRVRAKLVGSAKRPRVSVYRSNLHIYAQAVDDATEKTLFSASSKSLIKADKKLAKKTKSKLAGLVGENLAEQLKAKKIKEVVFDRGAYRFHGRVKALAEGLKTQGIKV